MIKNCMCIGVRNGVTKDNKPFARVYVDVSPCVPYDDKTTFGSFVENIAVWDNVNPNIVGKEILCSVDKFGHLLDIEYSKERSSS